MADFKILNDFVPQSMADTIEHVIMYDDFKYQPATVELSSERDTNDINIKDTFQFVKGLININHLDGSISHLDPLFDQYAKPILWFMEKSTGIKVIDIFRVKINLLLPNNTNENNYSPPHYDDQRDDMVSMVYYINNADGDTFIFNKDGKNAPNNLKISGRSSPKKGNAVIFKSNQWHASSNPIKYSNRFIMNFVFQAEPESFKRFINE